MGSVRRVSLAGLLTGATLVVRSLGLVEGVHVLRDILLWTIPSICLLYTSDAADE